MGPMDFNSMGTEMMPTGNGPSMPGSTPMVGGANMMSTGSMQGPMSGAVANIGYHPSMGRADRLGANIVGGNGTGKF